MVKVRFVWSFIYEQSVHHDFTKGNFDYAAYHKFVYSFLRKVEPKWRKVEKNLFDYCEKITGLKWKIEEIPAYVVKISSIMPFSDPLTIPIQLKSGEKIFSLTPERFIDMLIHELIHNLFIQNEREMGSYFDFVLKKYDQEEFDTSIHLLLHSVHKKIFLKFFGVKRLNQEIKMNEFYPAYRRSWKIVNTLGENKIIQEFRDYFLGHPKEKAYRGISSS